MLLWTKSRSTFAQERDTISVFQGYSLNKYPLKECYKSYHNICRNEIHKNLSPNNDTPGSLLPPPHKTPILPACLRKAYIQCNLIAFLSIHGCNNLLHECTNKITLLYFIKSNFIRATIPFSQIKKKKKNQSQKPLVHLPLSGYATFIVLLGDKYGNIS